jgi:hypothetical protein
VRDIKAEGYTIVSDGDVTVAAVVAPLTEEAATATTEAAAAEPEVVPTKGKKEAEGAAAEGAKETKKEKK